MPKEGIGFALAACWVHDTLEDCRQTYNAVSGACGETVAEIAYAVTNEKGKTRKERANDKYYEGIRATPFATYVKLCDRLANVRYSKDFSSGMLDVYRNEYQDFHQKLWTAELQPMFDELEALFS